MGGSTYLLKSFVGELDRVFNLVVFGAKAGLAAALLGYVMQFVTGLVRLVLGSIRS